MLGHDVTVKILNEPLVVYQGVLDRLDALGAVVIPQSYGKRIEPVFVPMHRIKEIVDHGRRPG